MREAKADLDLTSRDPGHVDFLLEVSNQEDALPSRIVPASPIPIWLLVLCCLLATVAILGGLFTLVSGAVAEGAGILIQPGAGHLLVFVGLIVLGFGTRLIRGFFHELMELTD